MNEKNSNPTVRCWVKHLLEAVSNPENKSFLTIFGEIKRVRLIGIVINKSEFIHRKNDEESINLRFIIDDGSGLISAVKLNAKSEKYKSINKGDLANLVGIISTWDEEVQITIQFINKIEDPNVLLLHNSEILYKLKKGELHKVPPKKKEASMRTIEGTKKPTVDEFIFNEETKNKIKIVKPRTEPKLSDDIQNKILLIIEEHSHTGEGISLDNLNSKLQIPKNKLISHLINLERASKIYQSQENIYQSF